MTKKPFVGVDLGGTSLLAAVVDTRQGVVLGESKRKTQAELGAVGVTERIAKAVRAAIKAASLKKKDIAGVGVGVPGPVHPDSGIVLCCPNMGPSWDNYALVQSLEQLLELPVTLDNDVRVGAVGEHTFGAGQGTENMLAIFVGTGIGGGLIVNGKLYSGSRSSAGEVGHMVILAEGPVCGCGERGHAEALASRTAMERDIRVALENGRASIIPRLMHESGREQMTSSILGDAYDAGDTLALEVVERAQYYLGLLIGNCVNLFDPEVIVVGGGVIERMGAAYLEPVCRAAQQHYINKAEADHVRIVPAGLGDHSGAMGAAVLARQRLD